MRWPAGAAPGSASPPRGPPRAGAEHVPLDALEGVERGLDRGALALGAEVGAQASAEVARPADVEHLVVPVAGSGRRPDARALRRRGSALHTRGGRAVPRAQGRRRPWAPRSCASPRSATRTSAVARVGERAVAGVDRGAEEVRQGAEAHAGGATGEQPAREPDGVEDGRGEPPALDELHLPVEEAGTSKRALWATSTLPPAKESAHGLEGARRSAGGRAPRFRSARSRSEAAARGRRTSRRCSPGRGRRPSRPRARRSGRGQARARSSRGRRRRRPPPRAAGRRAPSGRGRPRRPATRAAHPTKRRPRAGRARAPAEGARARRARSPPRRLARGRAAPRRVDDVICGIQPKLRAVDYTNVCSLCPDYPASGSAPATARRARSQGLTPGRATPAVSSAGMAATARLHSPGRSRGPRRSVEGIEGWCYWF